MQPKHSITEAGDIEELAGLVQNIVFRADDTGYTVCSVKTPDQKDSVTVVGNCATLWVGETIKATGRWVRHRQHGFQFQAESMTCVAPTSARGIERYLGSGMIKGIGKVMANRLVQAFGEDTLRIIEKESKRLLEVEGIGRVRRNMIKESWNEQKAVRDIMIFLQGHGVGTARSARIFKHYGSDAIAMITENPYRLCRDIWGIGFKKADAVAMSLGVPSHSETRARAGLVYVLQTITEEGHCFCLKDELTASASVLLDIPVEILDTALAREITRNSVVADGDRIYMAPLFFAEIDIAAKIGELLKTPSGFEPIKVDSAVPWAEKKMGLTFAPMQKSALQMALSEEVSIVTGGPGVGKTTIISAIVDVFKARKLSVALAAPTGRASKRMEEATRHEARTIHRMLKYMPSTGLFEHGPNATLPYDVVILDEVSMIDVQLMNAFLGALPDQCRLILVGDMDQLPSVGPGNVLRDLMDSGAIPWTKLETIFRQEAGGWIVQNAHRVNRGEALQIPDDQRLSDFYFVETAEPDMVIKRLLEIVTKRIPSRFRFNPMTDVQVLTPMRKNQLGADNLNAILQESLNPSGPEMQRFGRSYRLYDRVMQIRNNYDKGVFNGDIGRIVKVDTAEQQLTVDFEGRSVLYELHELDELMHAYACTIHKAQGCEYPAVVILLTTQHFKLLQRNLLYTALTRGKELVCLIGSSKAVWIAIRNNDITLRRTGLRDRLAGECGVRNAERGTRKGEAPQ